MSREDFTGYGFAVGSVKGLRSFRVDSLGRLTGVHYQEVWTPGENESSCQLGARSLSVSVNRMTALMMGQDVPSEELAKKGRAKEHDPATCACGYYAYYKGHDNPYHATEQVSAVVEGYGRTVLGSKGFRAEKARVVALCIPSDPKPSNSNWKMFGAWALLALALFIFSVNSDTPAIAITCGIVNALPFLWNTWNVFDIFRARFHAAGHCMELRPAGHKDCHILPRSKRIRDLAVKASPIPAALIRRNYPDVPTYPTEKAMLAAHPTDAAPVPEITPDTVDDFWTRSAS